jgi:hypothetical protein
MVRTLTIAVCFALAGAAAGAQARNAPPRTEQEETGFADVGGQSHVPYRIRLMPVSSFPQLPDVVARKLDGMGCMIPQTFAAHGPENVISGSFEMKGSADWAVLCSVHGVSSLYVFFESDLSRAMALRHQPDSLWLGTELGRDYGSAWGITTHPARLMLPADNADHDGIEDAFVDQSSVVHYFKEGRWVTLDSTTP